MAQPAFGQVKVDIDIVKPAASRKPWIRRGDVICLFNKFKLAIVFHFHTQITLGQMTSPARFICIIV